MNFHRPRRGIHCPVPSPSGAMEISQVPASLRARHLECQAKPIARRRCVGRRTATIDQYDVNPRIHRPVGAIRCPSGAMEISQVQASLRARHLDRRAKRFVPWRGSGKHPRKMTNRFVNPRIHRPGRGGCGFVDGTVRSGGRARSPGGRARGLAYPRLMSIALLGRSQRSGSFVSIHLS